MRILCWLGWHKWRRVDKPYEFGELTKDRFFLEILAGPMMALLDALGARYVCSRCGKEKS